MSYKLIATLVFVLLVLGQANARNYSITIAYAKLPSVRYLAPTVYDGNDAINIIGGTPYGTLVNDLVKYNITTDSIEVLAENIPSIWGSASLDLLGRSIYYMGGYNNSGPVDGIWKTQLSNPGRLVHVGNLPTGCSNPFSVWNDREYIYSIGGHSYASAGGPLDSVVRFSTTTNVLEVISRTPSPVAGASAVWDSDHKLAYIFGGFGTDLWDVDHILVFNETRGVVTKLDAVLPYPISYSCAVLIEHDVFILGGRGDASNELSFTKFDIETNEVVPLVVDNFPNRAEYLGCSWVESLNRIYIFGGYYNNSYQDVIMYIDMDEGDDESSTPTTVR